MTHNKAILSRLSKLDRDKLKSTSQEAAFLERKWARKFKLFFKQLDEEAALHLEAFETIEGFQVDILPLLLEHQFEVTKAAIIRAEKEVELPEGKRLAARKPFPRSLKELFDLYERWRVRKLIPKKSKDFADKLKKSYIQKVQSVWEKEGKEFRSGSVFDKEKAVEKIRSVTKMPKARSQMTVQTETTAYYNQGRRAVYDRAPEVTHYLFVAIRDHATTKWCRTRQGLVYDKGTEFLDKELPPIHWNCRSEMLPLTPFNPIHKKLIDDKSIQRKNRSPEPLPKGWSKR